MILYLDPSAWIKRWIQEEGSDLVRAAMADPGYQAIACSNLGRVEMLATFARAWKRRKRISKAKAERGRNEFLALWNRVVDVGFSPEVQARAEDLASRLALRGYDAVHLASALHLIAGGASVTLLTFDAEMRAACKAEGVPMAYVVAPK